MFNMPQTDTKLKPNLYLSFDIETNGNNPMLHSMISIGFYGITDTLNFSPFQYEANIEPLPNHSEDPECMKFWAENKDAYQATQINQKNYVDVMSELSEHFKFLSKQYNLKFIAMPACFDWMFFKSYYEMAQDASKQKFYDIGYHCICISSYFSSYTDGHGIVGKGKEMLKLKLMEYNKSNDHHAIEDAKCQAKLYVKTKELIFSKTLI